MNHSCKWCGAALSGAQKNWCSSAHKDVANKAARLWTEEMIEGQMLTWPALKTWFEGPYTEQQAAKVDV